jgi:hypothetical protein
MLEVADIFRLHGESFRATHALGRGQLRAMADIEHCRTAYFGGHLERCDRCGHEHYSYHSCRNRYCPKCHGDQTQAWLDKQQGRLLPATYYLLTFTLPSSLRRLARAHPRQICGLLMTRAVESLQKLVRDPQWLGAPVPVLAVLHTWTRALVFHPHVHLLVPAGGLSAKGTWLTARHSAFLVPGYALSPIFRAKCKAGLKRLGWLEPNDPCWKQKWHVHCRHAGSGQKVLDYLARYVFRVALVNSRLEALHQGQVTFRYRDNRTQQWRHLTLPAQEFIGRFLQHILPKGFVKVRTYGLWSATQHSRLAQVQQQLAPPTPRLPSLSQDDPAPTLSASISEPTRCPHCRLGHLIFIREILPHRNRPP